MKDRHDVNRKLTKLKQIDLGKVGLLLPQVICQDFSKNNQFNGEKDCFLNEINR
jgi:hypothetical protein